MTTTTEQTAQRDTLATPGARFTHGSASTWTASPMPGEAVIRINLLNASVTRGTEIFQLMGRDRELAYAIALRERPVPRAVLIADIWPRGLDDDATNAFNACLYRLRKRLGRRDAVVLTPDGYLLGPHVSSDLRALEIFAKTLAGRSGTSDYETELVRAAHRRLNFAAAPAPLAAASGDLFERRVASLKHGFARQLATICLRSNDVVRALDIARDMIGLDGCDESAWEIAIRAHIARHDRTSARRDYRTYAKNVARELGLPPSRVIRQLIARCADGSSKHWQSITAQA